MVQEGLVQPKNGAMGYDHHTPFGAEDAAESRADCA